MSRSSHQPESPLVICSRLAGEGYYKSLRHETRPVLCQDDFDYWQGLAEAWESGRTIVNVEHDIDVRERHLTELLDCPHPLCSWAYRCHWASTGIPGGVIAAGAGARDADNSQPPEAYYLQGGEEWAAWSAIGLVKITATARLGRPLRREPWNHLELAVHDAVKGPWHMHGNGERPGDFRDHVTHHHW